MTSPEGRPRVAIVTGGARGIGRAAAVRLAADACAVVVADLASAPGAEVVAEIAGAGGSARFVPTDVADAADVSALVRQTVDELGAVDALVASAGVLGAPHDPVELPLAEWHHVLEVNLTGVLHCCQAVLPHMLEQRWGRIVVLSSPARRGVPERVPYAVSKAGVVALVASLAHAYARSGVLANCVEPGRVLTDMVVPRFDAEHLANPPGISIGRYAAAEELAEVIAFLSSARCTYAVGAVWEATGGIQR